MATGLKRRTHSNRAAARAALAALLVLVAGCSAASAGDQSAAPRPGATTGVTPGTTEVTNAVAATTEADPPVSDDPDRTASTDKPVATDPSPSDTFRVAQGTGREPIEGPMVTTTAVPAGPIAPPSVTGPPLVKLEALVNLAAAFNNLTNGNAAVSVTVWRDHVPVFAAGAGFGAGGQPLAPDTPMVLASVSKLITSLTVARLGQVGAIDVDAPVQWDLIGVAHHPAWNDVTVRELLGHTAGMPKAQKSWLNEPGSCSIPLTVAMADPPTGSRGTWLYSNGNYCALGLLIEAVTGVDRGTAARRFVLDPIAISGPHLTTDGLFADDGPYAQGVARLDRLGGAGTWLASSDDLAAMLASVTVEDLLTITYPAIMVDQYGWGHTGTIDGAKSCAWVMEQGRTIVIGLVAGNRPSTGGRVCDALIPALAADLGIWADKPHRLPD